MSVRTIPNTYLICKCNTFKHWRRHVTYMNDTRHWLVLAFLWFTLCLIDSVVNISVILHHWNSEAKRNNSKTPRHNKGIVFLFICTDNLKYNKHLWIFFQLYWFCCWVIKSEGLHNLYSPPNSQWSRNQPELKSYYTKYAYKQPVQIQFECFTATKFNIFSNRSVRWLNGEENNDSRPSVILETLR
jgi:hypothetical protein